MNILNKYILLSQCLLLGLTSAYAGGDDEVYTSPGTRVSLTIPLTAAAPPSNTSQEFEVTLTGTRGGQRKYNLIFGTYCELFYHDTEAHTYIPFSSISRDSTRRQILDEKIIMRKRICIGRPGYMLVGRTGRVIWGCEHPDLTKCAGDILVSVLRKDIPTPYMMAGRTDYTKGVQGTFPIEVRDTGTLGFNAETTKSAWIMIDPEDSHAKLVVFKGKGPKTLLSLALAKTQENIRNGLYSEETVAAKLPRELSALIQPRILGKTQTIKKGEKQKRSESTRGA